MGKKKILIIEDDILLMEALKVFLQNEGFDVSVAIDGKSGVRIAEEEKPDLILLDLVLPKMHGFGVLCILKKNKNTKNIPVVVLTNLGQEEDKNKSMELGASDYCVKTSMNLSNLLKKVNKFLG